MQWRKVPVPAGNLNPGLLARNPGTILIEICLLLFSITPSTLLRFRIVSNYEILLDI